ncbi:MAG: DUF4157 domain-containing protein, partial [Planctomycetaceae bacterium]|nr:DUF4157 domain-containing protein [Planctomycetaceae bacterium]
MTPELLEPFHLLPKVASPAGLDIPDLFPNEETQPTAPRPLSFGQVLPIELPQEPETIRQPFLDPAQSPKPFPSEEPLPSESERSFTASEASSAIDPSPTPKENLLLQKARQGATRPLPMVTQTALGVLDIHVPQSVFVSTAATELVRQNRADALTIGEQIFVAAPAFAPETPRSLALLAHEATHVSQQKQSATASPHQREEQALRVEQNVLTQLSLPTLAGRNVDPPSPLPEILPAKSTAIPPVPVKSSESPPPQVPIPTPTIQAAAESRVLPSPASASLPLELGSQEMERIK